MSDRITVIDCGIGNIHSVVAAISHGGATPAVSSSAADIQAADRLVLPGVGSFGDAMANIREQGLEEAIQEFVRRDRPLLGICLGMQLLFESSDEFGHHAGLSLVPGEVKEIPRTSTQGHTQIVPHVGWSQVSPPGATWDSPLLDEVQPGTHYYFVHSFRAVPAEQGSVVGACRYGGHPITAIVQRGLVFGCQFHPEKSGLDGLQIVRNFLSL